MGGRLNQDIHDLGENYMELKLDKTTKILLGLIALGLFMNAFDPLIRDAYAEFITNSPQQRIYIECLNGCGST